MEQSNADSRIVEVGWWALLAPSADASPIPGYVLVSHDAARMLEGSYRLAEVVLRTADRQIVERVPTRSTGGWETLVSWPVIVEGSTDARPDENPWSVASLAAPRAHLAACLISLAWAEAWTVRITPTPATSVPPQVPELPSPFPEPEHNAQIGLRAAETLPPWIHGAWAQLATSSRGDPIASAVTAWHQGMLLFTDHPSMALIAFVASIEAAAASRLLRSSLPPPPDPCTSCGNRPGAAARFWAAAGLVASGEELEALRRAKVYELRSATGHRGATHGFERRVGETLRMPLHGAGESGRFVADTLRLVAHVGRNLLLQVLNDTRRDRDGR